MEVSADRRAVRVGTAKRALQARRAARAAVIWHDLECGPYRADLPLWLRLAERRPRGGILDVGAGTGRVSLFLARAGRVVVALDREEVLLEALRERAGNLPVRTMRADARDFSVSPADSERASTKRDTAPEDPYTGLVPAGGNGRAIEVCLVPMQTIQLLGGREGRLGLMRSAARALRPGGLLACAILEEVEPYDFRGATPGLEADRAVVGGETYTSLPLRVGVDAEAVEIERLRRGPRGAEEVSLVRLDRVSPRELIEEGASLGLDHEETITIEATRDHSGSLVVVLRA